MTDAPALSALDIQNRYGSDSERIVRIFCLASLAVVSVAQVSRGLLLGIDNPLFLYTLGTLAALLVVLVISLIGVTRAKVRALMIGWIWLYQLVGVSVLAGEVVGPMTILPPILGLLVMLFGGGLHGWILFAANLLIQVGNVYMRYNGVIEQEMTVITDNRSYLLLSIAILVLTFVCGMIGFYCNRVFNAILSLIDYQARFDYLTKVANRRTVDQALAVEIKRSTRNHDWISLLIIDVDNFKRYNDAFGHAAGDQCLIRIAELITRQLGRQGDVAGRYGGEEFVAILPATDIRGARIIAERIRTSVESAEIPSAGGHMVTITIGGCSVCTPSNTSIEAIYGCADRNLYEGKSAGRNCTVVSELIESEI